MNTSTSHRDREPACVEYQQGDLSTLVDTGGVVRGRV